MTMPRTAGSILVLLLVVGATPRAGVACTGDCNDSGSVTIEELVQGVTIALGNATTALCPAFDANGSGDVTVEELVAAVGSALDGCPATATPG